MMRHCSYCATYERCFEDWAPGLEGSKPLCQRCWARLNNNSTTTPSEGAYAARAETASWIAPMNTQFNLSHGAAVMGSDWIEAAGMPTADIGHNDALPWLDATVPPSAPQEVPHFERVQPEPFVFVDDGSMPSWDPNWLTMDSTPSLANFENPSQYISAWQSRSSTAGGKSSPAVPYTVPMAAHYSHPYFTPNAAATRRGSRGTSISPTPSVTSTRTRTPRSQRGSPGTESRSSSPPQIIRLDGSLSDDTKEVIKINVATPRAVAASIRRREIEALFHCDVPGCGSSFTRKHNLDNHARSHYDERRYICKWCHRAFVRKTDCDRHESRNCKSRGDAQPLFVRRPLSDSGLSS